MRFITTTGVPHALYHNNRRSSPCALSQQQEEFPMRFTPLCRNENALGKVRPNLPAATAAH